MYRQQLCYTCSRYYCCCCCCQSEVQGVVRVRQHQQEQQNSKQPQQTTTNTQQQHQRAGVRILLRGKIYAASHKFNDSNTCSLDFDSLKEFHDWLFFLGVVALRLVVVFTWNRSFYPTTSSAVHPVDSDYLYLLFTTYGLQLSSSPHPIMVQAVFLCCIHVGLKRLNRGAQ